MSKQTNKSVKMIDVGSKKVTKRVAVAEAFIHLNDSTKNKIYKTRAIFVDLNETSEPYNYNELIKNIYKINKDYKFFDTAYDFHILFIDVYKNQL